MTTCEFKKGDLVRLKSGGPVMTVENVNTKAACTWFQGNKIASKTFEVESLEYANTSPDISTNSELEFPDA